jgi:hypothetical protein
MASRFFTTVALAVALVLVASAKHKKFRTAFRGYADDKLNVHLISHTHGKGNRLPEAKA